MNAPPPVAHTTSRGEDERMMTVDAAQQFIAHAPDVATMDWLDLSNLASAHYIVCDTTRARFLAERAISLERNASTLLNLAVIMETYGDFRGAHSLAREAFALDPADPFVGGLYADSLIRLGRWREGWPVYTHQHANWDWLRVAIPEWPGPREPLAGRRILVLEGGGFGDNLLFLRWLPRLASLGANVTYMCPRTLCPLLENVPYINHLLPTDNGRPDQIVPADYHCFVSLLALARCFEATVDGHLWWGPYLFAHPEKSSLRAMPLGRRVAPRVGFCWKAGEHVMPRKHRSLLRTDVQRILDAPTLHGVQWVSLVADEPPPPSVREVLSPCLRDWSDTAAVIDNLDLVITVDTGVAHLAGAMGKPTWTLLPGLSSWPFLLDRCDSPLYPSMRLFRNSGEGIHGAVEAVLVALQGRLP